MTKIHIEIFEQSVRFSLKNKIASYYIMGKDKYISWPPVPSLLEFVKYKLHVKGDAKFVGHKEESKYPDYEDFYDEHTDSIL